MATTNASDNYTCPICLGVQHVESADTLIVPSDIIYKDDLVTVLINSFFVGKNSGHVIVVPNMHYENIYDLPHAVGHHIFDITKRVATVMKSAYSTDGITIRQNNEPAGDQHAFHYHTHIFPRYKDDGFNSVLPEDKKLADPTERSRYAEILKNALKA